MYTRASSSLSMGLKDIGSDAPRNAAKLNTLPSLPFGICQAFARMSGQAFHRLLLLNPSDNSQKQIQPTPFTDKKTEVKGNRRAYTGFQKAKQ